MDPFQEEHNITGRTCIMYRPFHAPHVLFSDIFFFNYLNCRHHVSTFINVPVFLVTVFLNFVKNLMVKSFEHSLHFPGIY